MHPPDHLLRTLAAVPASSRILDLECGVGARLRPLARLGFEVWACDADEEAVEATRRALAESVGEAAARERVAVGTPGAVGYDDAFFEWVVACGVYQRAERQGALRGMFAEGRRVLKPGGWVYAVVRAENGSTLLAPDRLDASMEAAGLRPAEAPAEAAAGGGRFVHAIYRRVEGDTPG